MVIKIKTEIPICAADWVSHEAQFNTAALDLGIRNPGMLEVDHSYRFSIRM